ncbi:hypothetical protein pdam_00012998 [Pocillopora damicornis]|uniref:Uncharacterized protein n=1 Tax=Pocillopora damicornis TaxID=46731 RepID=A0A3M6U5L4_POCDA|nr:hypothetical protein pdam_00012998 [Pocillopora damicornis]
MLNKQRLVDHLSPALGITRHLFHDELNYRNPPLSRNSLRNSSTTQAQLLVQDSWLVNGSEGKVYKVKAFDKKGFPRQHQREQLNQECPLHVLEVWLRDQKPVPATSLHFPLVSKCSAKSGMSKVESKVYHKQLQLNHLNSGSDKTQLAYELTTIRLEYEIIHSQELADKALSNHTNGRDSCTSTSLSSRQSQ